MEVRSAFYGGIEICKYHAPLLVLKVSNLTMYARHLSYLCDATRVRSSFTYVTSMGVLTCREYSRTLPNQRIILSGINEGSTVSTLSLSRMRM